jgi:outer membrane immunogenic protein
MKRALAAALAAAIATAASAADYPAATLYSAARLPSSFNWLGPYLGLNFGYQWSWLTENGLGGDGDFRGFAGGAQAGYTWQTGAFVYGVETDLQLSGAEDTFASYKFANPWFGTVRGRAGYALNNVMFYGTLGLAYGGGRIEVLGLSESKLHPGWTAGAGMEVSLLRDWSARAEYLFVDLADERYGVTRMDHAFRSSILRFGFNYRF